MDPSSSLYITPIMMIPIIHFPIPSEAPWSHGNDLCLAWSHPSTAGSSRQDCSAVGLQTLLPADDLLMVYDLRKK